MGFGMPVEHWLRSDLRELTADLLRSQQARNRGVIDTRQVELLLNDHQHHMRNHTKPIWTWLCFELWCRVYLDQVHPDSLALRHGDRHAPALAG
jgi:asparagine synthase (glutamine-hydrolysing)